MTVEFPSIIPRRAPVVPRASAYPAGESLPLQHHVQCLLDTSCRLAVNVFGPEGSGKSFALAHLASLFTPDKVQLIDHRPTSSFLRERRDRLMVYTSELRDPDADLAFEMTPWQEDDIIEYLLQMHRDKCKSVVQRITTADQRAAVGTLPALWAVVLEEFAADDALEDIPSAFRRYFEKRLGDRYHEAASYCLQMALADGGMGHRPAPLWNLHENLLRRTLPAASLAGERLATEIAAGNFASLRFIIPESTITQALPFFPPPFEGLRVLAEKVITDESIQPTGVSFLLAANPAWRPAGNRLQHLEKCTARAALWKSIDLSDADLRHANLSRANLEEVILQSAEAGNANFHGTNLRMARLDQIEAKDADFSSADLTGAQCKLAIFHGARFENAILNEAHLDNAIFDHAQLAGARLIKASLRAASFKHTQVEGADFSHADLTDAHFWSVHFKESILDHACFQKAILVKCNLEGIDFPNADFQDADLTGSYLTASMMPGANFRFAKLRRTGLADVRWENADLTGVDFTGATFHMGSSRSGLVDSPLASEGTRTGFYTDDYNDQDFKPPEEIRKANLCGCDLRDAIVIDADFYLVDLRGARYSAEQARHFARCGAILRTRV